MRRVISKIALTLPLLVVSVTGCDGDDRQAAAPGDREDTLAVVPEYDPKWGNPRPIGGSPTVHPWNGEGWAYVANEVSGGVTVVDLKTNQPVDYIPAGNISHHPHITRDQRWVLVTNRYDDFVLAIDTENNNTLKRIATGEGSGPLHIGQSPDGRWAAAALNRSGQVAIIDARPAELVRIIDGVGKKPRDPVFALDGRKLFVSLQAEPFITVIDTDDWEVRHLPRLAENVGTDYSLGAGSGLDVSPDGRLVAVSNTLDNEVVFFDAETEQVVGRVGGVPRPVNPSFLGTTGFVGTGNRASGTVSIIDTREGKFELVRTLETGPGANIPNLGPDGAVYATANGARAISRITPEYWFETREIPVVQNPHWIVFSPDGSRAYITNWGDKTVTVVDMPTFQTIATVTTGLNPNGIVIKDNVPENVLEAYRARTQQVKETVELASTLVMPEPQDEDERQFLQNCTVCHDVGRIVRNNAKTEAQWWAIVDRMRTNGAQLTPEEAEAVVRYLAAGRHQGLDIKTALQAERGERGAPRSEGHASH